MDVKPQVSPDVNPDVKLPDVNLRRHRMSNPSSSGVYRMSNRRWRIPRLIPRIPGVGIVRTR